MSTFNDLCIKHGTDKGTTVRECHGYSFAYEDLFNEKRNEKLKILEIGIADPLFPGASLKVLTEYFSNSIVYGFDIVPCDFNIKRTKLFKGDTSSREGLVEVLGFDPEPFDIVIDDGSHIHEHHLLCFNEIFPRVSKGGLYIIEDLQAPGGEKTINYFYNDSNTQALKNFGVARTELRCYNKLLAIIKNEKTVKKRN